MHPYTINLFSLYGLVNNCFCNEIVLLNAD